MLFNSFIRSRFTVYSSRNNMQPGSPGSPSFAEVVLSGSSSGIPPRTLIPYGLARTAHLRVEATLAQQVVDETRASETYGPAAVSAAQELATAVRDEAQGASRDFQQMAQHLRQHHQQQQPEQQ